MECKVLKSKVGIITNEYGGNHTGVDLVGNNHTLDYVVAHTSGKVVLCQDGMSNAKGSSGNASYGNYVKIDHGNGYATLYAHMQKGLSVKLNDSVKSGDILGYMGDSGNAYGGHLHFEVWKDNVRINPTEYLNKGFSSNNNYVNKSYKYKVGDMVNINGVYVSSDSTEKLSPLVTRGTITKIVSNTKNPYLLNNGAIGWVNDDVIVKDDIVYLINKSYKGNSIVDALNEIKVDSSFSYRAKLASVNNIVNYSGTAEQNTKLLELLKQGSLIKY